MTRREKRIIDTLNDVDRGKSSYMFDVEFDNDDRTYIVKKYYTGKIEMYATADEVSLVKERCKDCIQ